MAHWQHVQALQAAAATTQLHLLTDQHAHGTHLLRRSTDQVSAASAASAAAASQATSLASAEAELLRQQSDGVQALQAGKCRQEQLRKKVRPCVQVGSQTACWRSAGEPDGDSGARCCACACPQTQVTKLSAGCAAAEVNVAAAAAAAQHKGRLLQTLTAKLQQHRQQEAQHKAQAEAAVSALPQLQEAQEAAEARLAAAQAMAAGCDSSKEGLTPEQQRQLAQHQQQQCALAAQLQALELDRAAAASKADRAGRTVTALQQQAREAGAAAAKQQQQLAAAEQAAEQAQADVAKQQAGVKSAEQAWVAASLQHQQLQEKLQEAHDAHKRQHASAPATGGAQPRAPAPGAWPAYDAAVQHLAAASSAGQLPGRFHGRLCNLVAVRDVSAHTAANAALQERANLNSMLVVSERATAAAVIEHFRQHRVGTVQCKILAELQQQGQRGSGAGRMDRDTAAQELCLLPPAAAAAGASWLLGALTYSTDEVPGLAQLLDQLLGGWLLVPDRQAAAQLMHLKHSMVTRWGVMDVWQARWLTHMGLPPWH